MRRLFGLCTENNRTHYTTEEVVSMKNKVRGGAFRLVGLILGIIGATVSITGIIFSAIGLHQAHLCKKCNKGEAFK